MKKILYKLNFYNILIGFLILTVINELIGSIIIENVLYRSLTVFLSIFVLVIAFFNKQLKFLRGSLFFLYLIFVFFYLLKIFIDLFIHNVRLDPFGDLNVFYLSVISYTLIYPLSIATFSNLETEKLQKYFYFIYALPFVIYIVFISITSTFGIIEDRESPFESMGLNTISMYAAIIAAWSFLILIDRRKGLTIKLFSGFILFAVFYFLAVAATRSAFVAISAVIIVYLIVNFKHLTSFKYLLNLIIIFILILLSAPYWLDWFELVLTRFSYGIETGSTGRDHIYPKAFEMFLENPFTGGYFVLPHEAYFHNSFLDAFVSTGFFGGIIFLILNFKVLKVSFSFLKVDSKNKFFSVGFIISLVLSLFTSNLFSNFIYWSFLICIIVLYEKNKYYEGYNKR